MVLVNQFLKNLKTLSLYKKIIIILVLLTCVKTSYIIKNDIYKTHYEGIEREIIGYIMSYKIDGNHLQLLIKGSEKIIVNYYFDTEDQLNEFKEVKVGDYIQVLGSIYKPSNNRTFNLFNYNKFLKSKKIYWLFKADNIVLINKSSNLFYLLKNKIIKRIDNIKYSSNYIKALVLADKSEIDPDVIQSYQNNGINHLLAVSGSHVSFFLLIINYVLNKIKTKIKTIITVVILLFYLIITMYPASLIRSVVLYVILIFNKKFKLNIRPNEWLILLCIILLLYNPYYIYDVGFLFSFIISFYIITFSDIIKKINNKVLKLFTLSLIAFIAGIPILINTSFQVNFLSPLINIIFVPLFIFIIFPLSLLTFVLPVFDKLLFTVIIFCECINGFFIKINFLVFSFPKLPLVIIMIYYITITYVLYSWEKRKYFKMFYLIIMLAITYQSNYFYPHPIITFIDVGQGDSILVQLPFNSGNILIDTGGIIKYKQPKWKEKSSNYSLSKGVIIPYIKSVGIKRIDYLILTHGHYDHLGEAINIINNLPVSNIIFNSGNNNNLEQSIIELATNKNIKQFFIHKNKLNIENYQFYFLNQKNTKDENEDSLIIYTKLNDYHILLLGDAGIESEKYLLKEYNLPQMDILKVGHHGSKYSSSPEFINNIKPKHSFITAGVDNRFNHPHSEVLDLFKNEKLKYYETSISGSIKVILKKKLLIKSTLTGR